MRTFALTCALLAVLALLAACGDDDESTSPTATPGSATPSGAASPTPTPSAAASPSPTSSPGADVCAPNPDPAPAGSASITSPPPGDSVTTPVTITGTVEAFEAAFKVTIYDEDQQVIADAVGMSQEGQTVAPFSIAVSFLVAQPTPACIWVYELSAMDGSVIDVTQVPVKLLP